MSEDRLLDWYRCWARNPPPDAALAAGGSRLGYAELWEQAAALAQRMRGRGVLPGTPVVLAAAPGAFDWVTGLLAILQTGAQAILPDPAWPGDLRDRIVSPLAPGGAVLAGRTGPEYAPLGRPTVDAADAQTGAGVWLFTSGTTAQPKPRFRSTACLAAHLHRLHGRLPACVADGRPASLCLLPLYHGFGLLNALLLIHTLGGTVRLAGGENPPELIDRHAIRVIYAWPSHFAGLAESAGGRRASSLQWCVSSATRLYAEVAARFAESYGCPIRQQYGSTETGPLCLDSAPVPHGQTGCVGTPLPGVELQIQDDRGQAVTPGVEGMVAVRLREGLAAGTPLAADGFFHPGDLGHVDAEGRLFLGRRLLPFHDERAYH